MENKIHLENGEVMDLGHCKTCDKDYVISQPKVEDVDPDKEFITPFSKWMYEKFGKDLVRVEQLRTCDCGTFPDMVIKVKDA